MIQLVSQNKVFTLELASAQLLSLKDKFAVCNMHSYM